MKNITDIFFDLDHTLWDFDKNSEITYTIIFNELNLVIDLKKFLQVYQQENKSLWKLFREEKIDKETLRYDRLKNSFSKIGVTISDTLIDKIAEKYIYYLSKQTHLIDGVLPLLVYLKPNYKLHIITNGFAGIQTQKLINTNLINYFDVVVNSETVAAKKPNPVIFEKAVTLAKVAKENSLMIGDSYEADVLGALEFGMNAICYNYHNEILPSHIKQINHLEELIGIL